MRTGRDCVRYLKVNFEVLEYVEEWRGVPNIPGAPAKDRREETFYRRMRGAKSAGALTVEEGFRILAWYWRKPILPGFFTEPERI